MFTYLKRDFLKLPPPLTGFVHAFAISNIVYNIGNTQMYEEQLLGKNENK